MGGGLQKFWPQIGGGGLWKFRPKKGGVFDNKYGLYAYIHYIMMFYKYFFSRVGSWKFWPQKREGYLKILREKRGVFENFRRPTIFFKGGSLKLWTLPNISKLLLIKMITDRITNRRRPQQYSQLLKSIWSKKAASLGVFISLLKCCPPVKAVGDLQKNY